MQIPTQEFQVIEAYLVDGRSHRDIQRTILKIPAPQRGGGFEAMKILHEYGIIGKDKSTMTRKSLLDIRDRSNNDRRTFQNLLKAHLYR